ncbi:MAG: DNA cytosine methyltransferase [Spirochaetota bacterium]
MSKILHIADLFCGAGGTSTGATQAAEALGYQVHLTAINHWQVAVNTHTLNHEGARHLCASLDALNPRDLYKPGELDLLWASPECTHHSIARGGKPIHDQSRATAWCVVRWAEALMPPVILIENVPEFATWGPIGTNGRPMKSRKGETFRAWCAALASCGYKVDHRLLVAADYGDPTTRRRLFVQAVRGNRSIRWPDPTHAALASKDLFGVTRKPWRAAREIIDWKLPSPSIFTRKRPLSPNTLRRIEEGLRRFGVVEPFIISAGGPKCGARPVSQPMGTVLTRDHRALVEPFLIPQQSPGAPRGVSKPCPTISTKGAIGLVQPFIITMEHAGSVRSVDRPLPTITCAKGGAMGVAEPYLVTYYGNGQARPVDVPLDTVTTKERFGLVEPTVTAEGKRYRLDIRFRMLQPHELAGAQGFPASYRFSGTKTDAVKQIGNAVPCGLARALVGAALAA